MSYKPSKVRRFTGFLTGTFLGALTGITFLIVAWVLNVSLKIPFRYSLAASTIGAIVSIPTGIIIINSRKKSFLDLYSLFRFYILASVIGEFMGIWRWLFHFDNSIMAMINSFWSSFSENCVLPIFGLGAIIAAVVWVLSLGKSSGVQDAIFNTFATPVFMFLLAISPVALLADAPLWSWFVPLLEKHTIVVTILVTSALGAVIGLCWPPVLLNTKVHWN